VPDRPSTERWRQLGPFLERFLDAEVRERESLLAALALNEATLAAELRQLLEEHRLLQEEGFLERPAVAPPASLAGHAVGAYTLRSEIGLGGMGSVWLAERTDGRFEGQVAVKLLNASRLGGQGQARFRREGSILARLRHPHIAQLVDAGVSVSGQPYLVLEYVRGLRIDEYCDDRRLGVEERLRLFLGVVTAVSHAHAHLIVHRDIKPSNVLVTEDGAVKLLDFGIAKLLERPDGVAATALTREGEAIMTPEYAAPEQLTGGEVTTSTDVYALGVLLYVLLSGSHPTGREGAPPAALVRAIVSEEAPRLSQAVAGAVGHATRRGTTPRRLGALVRGDLENIAAKALKKAPAERYASAEALAADLLRFLAHQPVAARPDSFLYRAAKFTRRHRPAVAMGGVALLALAAGGVGTVSQARRAREEATVAQAQRARADEEARRAGQQRDLALRELSRAEAAQDLNSYLLSDATPGDKPFTADWLLDRARDVVQRHHGEGDDSKVELLVQLGEIYESRQDNTKALPLLTEAYALAQGVDEPTTRARAACTLGDSVRVAGDLARAEALINEGLAVLPLQPQYAMRRALCLLSATQLLEHQGRPDEAVARMEEALRVVRSSRMPPFVLELDISAQLAQVYRRQGRLPEAASEMERLWAQLRALGRERTDRAATLLNNWGVVMTSLGQPRKAEELFRRAIAVGGVHDARDAVSPPLLANLADVMNDLGRFAEGIPLAEKSQVEAVRLGARRHVDRALLVRARLYLGANEPRRAARALAELEPRLKKGEAAAGSMASLAMARAQVAVAQGDGRAAALQARRALDLATSGRVRNELMVHVLLLRAAVHLDLRRAGDAQADAERALSLLGQAAGPDAASCWRGEAYLRLAQAQAAQGQAAAARSSASAATRELGPTLGPDHLKTQAARRLAG
jgi:eukaryotic-like serine/threonine-protein kinase